MGEMQVRKEQSAPYAGSDPHRITRRKKQNVSRDLLDRFF